VFESAYSTDPDEIAVECSAWVWSPCNRKRR